MSRWLERLQEALMRGWEWLRDAFAQGFTELAARVQEAGWLEPVRLFLYAKSYLALSFGLFALRTFWVIFARIFGLYAPEHYRYWPRLIPWRSAYRIWQGLSGWHERVFVFSKRGGNGGFAGLLATLCHPFRSGMVHLGRAYGWGLGLLQPVGYKVLRHLFMLAMTGTGKTTALITILSTWRGSAYVIDPKAQIIKALAYLDKKRRWFVFDPDGISGLNSIGINVFDCIKEAVDRDGEGGAVLWAMRIAEALIVTPSGSKSPYFFDVARQYLAGLILHVLSAHPPEHHHLPFVRDLVIHGYRVFEDGKELTQGDEAQELLWRSMVDNPAYDGVIAGAVSAMRSASGETAGNVTSTLQEQTEFLDIPNLRAVLRHSDLSLAELKVRGDIVLAFCASIYSMREELSRLSRLLTNMTAYTFEAERMKKGSCLCIVDELPSQGYNPTLEVMLAVDRSMGITFLGVSQNVELMKKHYPGSWKSFIGEGDATFWMGGNHPDNAALLSQMLGKTTIITTEKRTRRKETREVSVMEPEQVTRFLDPNSERLIVTRAGGRAFKLVNDPYFKALPVWRYAADPDHKESWPRRLARAVFGRGRRARVPPARNARGTGKPASR